jgi:hypothetical protein
MTDIDISKIKPGDYVTVRAKCIATHLASITLRDADNDLSVISMKNIIGHEPAPEPLKVGDVVTVDNGFDASRFTVVALHGNNAWVLDAEKTIDALFHVSRLRRVEQP